MVDDNIPLKQCSSKAQCVHPDADKDGWLPATLIYFRKFRNGLYPRCRKCEYLERQPYNALRRDWRKHGRPAPVIDPRNSTQKQCSNKDKCIHPEADEDGWLPRSIEYFAIRKQSKDGFRGACRSCRSAYSSQYFKTHRRNFLRYGKKWRQLHPEQSAAISKHWIETHKNQHRALCRRWNKSHSAELKAAEKRRRLLHPEIRRVIDRRYDKNHPDQVRLSSHKRRSQKRSLPSTFTAREWDRALAYFNDRCAVCGKSADFWTVLAMDHWQPLSKGGPTIAQNMIPLCHTRKDAPAGQKAGCNNVKFNRDPVEFLETEFGKRKAKKILVRVNAYFDSLRSG